MKKGSQLESAYPKVEKADLRVSLGLLCDCRGKLKFKIISMVCQFLTPIDAGFSELHPGAKGSESVKIW